MGTVSTALSADGFERAQLKVDACAQPNTLPSFEEVFTSHKDRVYSIALRYTGDRADALDISQQVFLKLMAQMGSFRNEASFDSWLYRIVVNCCLDHRRRNWRWLPFVQETLEKWQASRTSAPAEAALDGLMQTEMQQHVQRAISLLPPDLRMVVVLRYTEGLSYEDIASALRVPRGHSSVAAKSGAQNSRAATGAAKPHKKRG